MKFAATATTLAVAAILAINGATATPDAAPAAAVAAVSASNVISPQEAFEAVKSMDLPAGVTLTGSVESIKEPANANTAAKKTEADHDDNKEWFGGVPGWGGIGGWGGWGGWGGFGPYRFGFNCGGLGGWAYPLGFWNTFGVGLYGGGCGLGIPFGGLYYC